MVALFNLPIAAPGCGGALVEASTVLTGATGSVGRLCLEAGGAAVRCTWLHAGGVSCVASACQRPVASAVQLSTHVLIVLLLPCVPQPPIAWTFCRQPPPGS